MKRHFLAVFAVAAAALAAVPGHAAQRAYVASNGNDANAAAGCVLTAPCRSFAAAHAVVDPGGEIVALDAAGYGVVTITKSVTITANPGFFAGIAASTGNAVTIATPGVNVTLRGLALNGLGAANGVVMSSGARLSVENCVVSGFTGNGVQVNTGVLRVLDSLFRDNPGNGIYVSNGTTASVARSTFMGQGTTGVYNDGNAAGLTTTVSVSASTLSNNFAGLITRGTPGSAARTAVSRSTSSNNGTGIANNHIGGTTVTTLSYNQVTGNTSAGLYNEGAAVMESIGNNHVRQNTADVVGTLTTVSGT